MSIGLTILVCSILYLGLTAFMYYSKQRTDKKENIIYSLMIISAFLGIVLEILCIVVVPMKESFPIMNEIINRMFLIYILTWVSLFTAYIYTISLVDPKNKISLFLKNKKQLLKTILIVFYTISCILLIILPLNYYYDGLWVYSYGLATSVLYFVNVILICIWVMFLILNKLVIKSISPYLFL